MSSAAQVAAAREETRKKLHEKIESYEKGELGQEYHRTYPFKIPTAIRGERYVLKIHFFIESGQKIIQFKIQFKTKSRIFIQKNIHSVESRIFNRIIHL